MAARTRPEELMAILVRERFPLVRGLPSCSVVVAEPPPSVAEVLLLHVPANARVISSLGTRQRVDVMDVTVPLCSVSDCPRRSLHFSPGNHLLLPVPGRPLLGFRNPCVYCHGPTKMCWKHSLMLFLKTPYSFTFHVQVFYPSGIYFCVCDEIDI